jgi:predicted transcriptional regulator
MSDQENTIDLATELTVAWLSNPNTRTSAEDVPAFLRSMHEAVAGLGTPSTSAPAAEPTQDYTPAVSARKSLASKDQIISMIDGKPYKTLRRHLAGHGLTPDEYRSRYGLKADYPMVAETYSEARRAMAKKIGLGRNPGATATKGDAAPKPKTKRAPKPQRLRRLLVRWTTAPSDRPDWVTCPSATRPYAGRYVRLCCIWYLQGSDACARPTTTAALGR